MSSTKKKISTLKEFVAHLNKEQITPRIKLSNGASLSVQAGSFHYSTPRQNSANFTHVEVGYPSFEPPELWKSYAEDTIDYTNTIYPYLPIELVLNYINSVGIK